MRLHCTLVGGPGSGLASHPLELTIDAPEGAPGAALCRQLAEQFGTGMVTVAGEDLQSARLGIPPLIPGAILVDGGPEPRRRKQRRSPCGGHPAGLVLAVHTGAGAGTVVPLQRGQYTVGRSNARIVLPDAELSREHARLTLTDKDIFIEDLDSANGTYVDGERIRHSAVTAGSTIRCGNSTMSLMFADVPIKSLAMAGVSAQEPITVPGRGDPGNRAALLVTAALPLAIGIGLALFTGMWMFLAFAATSAVALLVPVVSGRRQRRDAARAVRKAAAQDRERRLASGPSLAVTALATRKGARSAASVPDTGGIWLRLGEAEQDANVTTVPAAALEVPSVDSVPVTFDLLQPRTVFVGTKPLRDGMIRAIVMQLSGYPRCRSTRIIIFGPATSLPLAARYLPDVVLMVAAEACRDSLKEGFPPGYEHGVLLLADATADGRTAAMLMEEAHRHGWQVLEFRSRAAAGTPAVDVVLHHHGSTLRGQGEDITFVADLAQNDVFDGFCRQLAAAPPRPNMGKHPIARTCALEDVLPLSPAHLAARWDSSIGEAGLAAPLGLDADGALVIDLQADGPHVLVAGTTGAGKSELLRSLTLALALTHPPSRINFLFLDFKGGSGLGPLTGLVHCVGLLTDLTRDELERTLTSLRAEIRLREEALAAARVPDLAGYRSTAEAEGFPIPHLVIIIDEFRMLVDDAPEVLRELMRIASIGRSLGIHLVMATQRPQGALTADIRANVTSSIALRVQSDMESVDIIGSKEAAAIRLDAPGRAFMTRGTEPAREFQAATTNLVRTQSAPLTAITVQLTTEHLTAGAPEPGHAEPQTPAQAAAPLIAMIRGAWTSREGAAPRVPVAPPLPDDIVEPSMGCSGPDPFPGDPAWALTLGAMDLPKEQSVHPLVWRPGADSHLALIGAPESGADEAAQLVLRGLLLHREPAHCYILDGTGSFSSAARHPRVGAATGLHELRRAVRILERIALEMTRRLSRPAEAAVPLVVLVSGWGAWVSAFRSGPLAWAEELMHDVVRDGVRAGVTVVISGDRELVSARFCGALSSRLYFPAGSNQDSRVAWPRLPSTTAIKSRAVAFGPVANGDSAVCQVFRLAPGRQWPEGPLGVGDPAEPLPFRVEPLPLRVTAPEVRGIHEREGVSANAALTRSTQDMLIGVGGDELSPVYLRLAAAGTVAVLGRSGSGKTNTLKSLQELNPAHHWLSPNSPTPAANPWIRILSAARAGDLPSDAVLLADDADLLSPAAMRDLSELQALGHPLVLTASYSPLLLQRVPPAMGARAAGTALLLGPASFADGDAFGVRFEVEPAPPPGRAVLISAGRAQAIQVARASEAELKEQARNQAAASRYSAGGALPVRDA
ncbi:FtsK/SpoIIIE domain-containing protein [Arthrobacter nitrophenolicus]|uniref:S-DNA-T family DNA segregation ATPase FtsK/SpoIIIE n=2 Tax=Arthrobacter nitrophenolicus TaxID=683150 RepID=A0ACC6TAT8_9MICC|nr:FtsK/SpoIIIE domain-containing protein [Arthrobacter nitrophenolicus]ELT45502.1 DNA segregation ATPase FtsK [Arthrobacter nitrophenolicus]